MCGFSSYVFSILIAVVLLMLLFFKRDHTVEHYVKIGSVKIGVAIAANPATRAMGLMFRNSLPSSDGMLFIFPDVRTVTFWMKNTYIPLDIAFIDDRGIILKIDSMKPHDETRHSSDHPVKYVLEVNRGFFSKRSINTGDKTDFSDSIVNMQTIKN